MSAPQKTHSSAASSSPLQPPTTLAILLHPTLSMIPPKSQLGAFLWRRRMWFEATFVFTMLEPWEKILLMAIINLILVLILAGIFQYFPKHLSLVYARAEYYWYGGDGGSFFP